MEISFFRAKNGNETCSVGGINIHSSYDPQKEADRFAENLEIPFSPSHILITEPALSYCLEKLRLRFPLTKFLAVRYCSYFKNKDKNWDKVFYFDPAKSLENEIFDFLGEEGVLNCFFAAWQPSSKAFEKQNTLAWLEIKAAVEKSRAVLATRSYFAKRWLRNSCRFFLEINKIVEAQNIRTGNSQVFITASGPSLKNSIPYLKKYRNRIFIIALSSSIEALLYHGLIPDMCISTDGGYYAKKHLEILERCEKNNIPLALSCESCCPSKILTTFPVIPLSYGDFPEKLFFDAFGIKASPAARNGTVSGTAVQFALSITSGNVYFCGLDMAQTKGFQHIQPNALENEYKNTCDRLGPLLSRITKTEFYSPVMEIYRNWFSNQKKEFYKRVRRISCNFKYSNKLGNMEDSDWADFSPDKNVSLPSFSETSVHEKKQTRIKKIEDLILSIDKTDEWLKNAFPADYICFKRSILQEDKERFRRILVTQNKDLTASLRRILNEHVV
ncbi:DUF115 domain-containing protein [Treponema parvum]|uniref:DUF115 domain-containing protein n=1 Tax=Treponema parvum TaxID=138851 RepID=A0A975F3M8_9SPIR|nr:6-hydroxymethylpterin diphosphokinase MptE-like protein [Treponema parvum]QTQ14120.1 DUF115 domain-containing protein [Treponema parvum]